MAGLWLAAFALFTAGIPILDAAVGHATDVVAHWEDAGDRDCLPQHDPASCQLCHAHTVFGSADLVAVPGRVAVVFASARPATDAAVAAGIAERGPPNTRGPPLG